MSRHGEGGVNRVVHQSDMWIDIVGPQFEVAHTLLMSPGTGPTQKEQLDSKDQ